MEVDKEDTEEGFQNQNPNPNPNQNKGSKGKSCKGCLYYSSLQRSKSKNPTCVGFSRTLHQGQFLNFFFFFFFFSLMVMMLVGLFGCRENQEMEKKILGFLFCAVFAHSVQNLMGFCFWIGRLGCCYFLVHNDENQNILLHDVIVVAGVFSR